MSINDERVQRYGTPIAIGMANGVDEPTITRAVMAVADAEQAELREERLRLSGLLAVEEAKVARVEALLHEAVWFNPSTGKGFVGYEDIVAALDGDS